MENDRDNKWGRNTETSQRATSSEDKGNELIPGFPNHLTLDLIVPKLPWMDVLALPGVSRAWQRATESRQVYNARVRAISTETLFAVVNCKFSGGCSPDGKHTIGLYCARDKRGYTLPPIPGLRRGIPYYCQCVSLDGYLYVLGGTKKLCDFYSGSTEVYVLDLPAGQKQWKQCASMHEPRMKFGVGVVDGKVYVFGGISKGRYSCECEVYDPKVNAWSQIRPMPSFRSYHKVSALGKELFVFGGRFIDLPAPDRAEDGLIDPHNSSDDEAEEWLPFDSDWLIDPSGSSDDEAEDGPLDPSGNSNDEAEDGLIDHHGSSDNEAEDRVIDSHGSTDDQVEDHQPFDPHGTTDDEAEDRQLFHLKVSHETKDASFLEVYDPVQDEWRVVKNWMRDTYDAVFEANGWFHAMNHDTIYLQNPTKHNWAAFQSSSFTGFGPVDSTRVYPYATVPLDGIDGELIALVHWNNWSTQRYGTAILRGEGFWGNSHVDWEILTSCDGDRSYCPPFGTNPFFCRVEL